MTQTEILTQEGIQNYPQDIRQMSKAEILANFSASSSGEPKAALIIRNLIWQTWSWIDAGKETQIEGNIRSYWYSHVKPTLARVDLLSGYDHYQTVLEEFGKLKEYGLCQYIDFGFDDDNWENRRIATKMPEVILFAEKTGWFRTLKEFYDSQGMTIVALGGASSLLSTEYLVRDLVKITTLDRKFYLISAVDYDPSGLIIARSFRDQLLREGLRECEPIDLISLDHYTPEEIELYKYPLPSNQATKVAKWLQATGGINGEPYGLEAESMPRERFKGLVRQTLKKLGLGA
jgi:hypothetical protein